MEGQSKISQLNLYVQRLLPISATGVPLFGINGFQSRNQPLHKRATIDSYILLVRRFLKRDWKWKRLGGTQENIYEYYSSI